MNPACIGAPAPATVLFADFAAISQPRVTLDTYQRITGAELSEKQLVATTPASKEEAYDASADMQAVKEYFLGLATSLRPVAIPEPKILSLRGADDLKNDLRTAREQMTALVPEAEPAHLRFKEADASLMQAVQAEQLILAGLESAPQNCSWISRSPRGQWLMQNGNSLKPALNLNLSKVLRGHASRLPFSSCARPDAEPDPRRVELER